MREKRRRTQTGDKGLAPGEKLDRNKLSQESNDRWGWVRHEVVDASQITTEHVLTVAGLGGILKRTVCTTPYCATPDEKADDGDMYITVTDQDEFQCEKKRCKSNPYCLAYLGQERWNNEFDAKEEFRKAHLPKADPRLKLREPLLPNLGATCYCNAFLQVWYQDIEFRSGVYKCELLDSTQDPLESPVFALQLTFAALQEGNQAVFNPVKLVESLKLRTSEQQDAQELSKLFMSLLDSEFKKQKDSKLQTLLADQFEGKLMYTTVCERCGYRSNKESSFLELEINLVKGEDLHDRLKAMCADERLTDDNKYFCGRCDSLQNATRHMKLINLPPVLHISILRFVYDIESGERRKSKLPLKFYPYLNLHTPARKPCAEDSIGVGDDVLEEQQYELRGVLLHKGQSAYHGHYMAQVYDVSAQKWYLFNDEKVTPIKSLHKPASTILPVDLSDDETSSKTKEKGFRLKSSKPSKRRRVDDSDIEEVVPPKVKDQASTMLPLVSSDAYMLIYARREAAKEANGHFRANVTLVTPPQRALDMIRSENESTTRECAGYEKMCNEVDEKFIKTRAMVLDIYRFWAMDFHRMDHPHVVVSKAGIERWLTQWFEDSTASTGVVDATSRVSSTSTLSEECSQVGRREHSPGPEWTPLEGSSVKRLGKIDNSDIVCPHSKLNPLDPQKYKVLNRKTYEKLKKRGYEIEPVFTREDVCRTCVVDEFPEKFYQVDHPLTVVEFNKVCNCETEDSGYWISKAWLKDWVLVRPKMHTPYKDDPPPDSGEYASHVVCEHNHLNLNVSMRRRISYEGVHILKAKFPKWYPPAWNVEVCPTCDAQLSTRRANRLELRKSAEVEKSQLRRLHEDNILGRQALEEIKGNGVIIKASFIRAWRSWLQKPCDVERPTSAETSDLLCAHGDVVLDLSNPGDFDDDLAVITDSEYDALSKLYTIGPKIPIALVTEISETGEVEESIRAGKPCIECRDKWLRDFESTTLTVVCLKAGENLPCSKQDFLTSTKGLVAAKEVVTNASTGKTGGRKALAKTCSGVRQSARIKENRSRCQLTVEVSKDSTILDVKLRVLEATDILASAQRLFYNGVEVSELTKTVVEIGVQRKDYIFMREVLEHEDAIEIFSDDERDRKIKRKRNEGDGFGGTLLSGNARKTSRTSRTNSENEVDELKAEDNAEELAPRTCSKCTYINGPDFFCCEMCLIPL